VIESPSEEEEEEDEEKEYHEDEMALFIKKFNKYISKRRHKSCLEGGGGE
jgi:hypothetical protein